MKKFLLMLLFGIIGLVSGCQSFHQALHQGRFETAPGRITPFAIAVKNDSSDQLVVNSHLSQEVLTVVPAHETRTIFVHLEYYERYYKVVLFASPLGVDMKDKFIPSFQVIFQNYREDPVYGSGWGVPQNEAYVWTVTDETFNYRSW